MATKKNIVEKSKPETQESLFYSFERGVTRTPEFKEIFRNGQPWINFGVDNLYPQELIRLYLDASSLHTSLIRKKGNMTSGGGFKVDGLNGAALNFLANRFANTTIDQIAYAAGIDYAMFGGFYLNITWSKDGNSISRIQHLPYEKVRCAKPVEGCDPEDKYFYVSRDWEFYRRKENTPVLVCGYNPLKALDEPNQVIFVKQYSPNSEYYSYCNYTSTLNWIKLAFEINVYHLKSIQNNMNSGLIIINKNGIPPAEMREQNYQELKKRYGGADAAGDILMVYAQNKDSAPEFIPFPNNGSDQRFKDLMEQVNQNILIGHDASSIIGNIETAGKLGAKTDVADSYEAFQNTVISPIQKVIEDTINKLANFNGIVANFELNKYNIYSTPVAAEEQKMYIEVKQYPKNNFGGPGSGPNPGDGGGDSGGGDSGGGDSGVSAAEKLTENNNDRATSIEDEIRNNPLESGHIIINGEVVKSIQGDKNSVNIGKFQDLKALATDRGLSLLSLTYTHNHPARKQKDGSEEMHGSAFSDSDIRIVVEIGIGEMRAVDGEFTYSLKAKKTINSFEALRVTRSHKKHSKEAVNKRKEEYVKIQKSDKSQEEKIKEYHKVNFNYFKEDIHSVMTKIAKDNPDLITYKRTKTK